MPNADFVLRIEATNINSFVWDTADLSTIRGSGLALLEWPGLVSETLAARHETWDVVTCGGSAITLVLKDSPAESIKSTLSELLTILRTDELFGLATYAGAAAELTAEAGYGRALQTAISAIRLQQSCQADVRIPATNTDSDTRSFCALNRILPSSLDTIASSRVSSSVAIRHAKGKQQKPKVFAHLTGERIQTTNDFGQLATTSVFARQLGFDGKNLNGYMGVVVLDGNGFGDIERRSSAELKTHGKWDSRLRSARKDFLAMLVDHAQSEERWLHDTRLRFETLLWGGDEQVWVVPAWVTMELIDLFFQATAGRNWQQLGNEERITHCGGVVLCHHKAPIRDAVQLAHKLLGTAKTYRNALPEQNAFCYQILESFDHLGESYERIRQLQQPAGMPERDSVLCHTALRQLMEFRSLVESRSEDERWLPATRRMRIQQALFGRDWLRFSGELERLIEVASREEQLSYVIGGAIRKWHEFHQPSGRRLKDIGMLPQTQSFWYHLLELWDYLIPGIPPCSPAKEA